jgi:hypothetical protein
MVFDELVQVPNVLFILPFDIVPEGTQFLILFSIGDILIVAPQGIQSFARIVVIVMRSACCFADMLNLFLCRKCHTYSPLREILFLICRSPLLYDLVVTSLRRSETAIGIRGHDATKSQASIEHARNDTAGYIRGGLKLRTFRDETWW